MDEPLVLDANAVAGEIAELLGVELTAVVGECAHCATRAPMGTLRAWIGGPGVVLRCSACHGVVVRWVRTPAGVRLDLRGVAWMVIATGTQ